jgi:hypothetical protein
MARRVKVIKVTKCRMTGTDHYCVPDGNSTCYIIKRRPGTSSRFELVISVKGKRATAWEVPAPAKRPAAKAGRRRAAR